MELRSYPSTYSLQEATLGSTEGLFLSLPLFCRQIKEPTMH